MVRHHRRRRPAATSIDHSRRRRRRRLPRRRRRTLLLVTRRQQQGHRSTVPLRVPILYSSVRALTFPVFVSFRCAFLAFSLDPRLPFSPSESPIRASVESTTEYHVVVRRRFFSRERTAPASRPCRSSSVIRLDRARWCIESFAMERRDLRRFIDRFPKTHA